MTKITTYNRGIIVDGHADTKEECETITLLCDSLAKDKNFKQVAYDKGYAAFERVGHTEELKFAPPTGDLLTWLQANGTKQEATVTLEAGVYTWIDALKVSPFVGKNQTLTFWSDVNFNVQYSSIHVTDETSYKSMYYGNQDVLDTDDTSPYWANQSYKKIKIKDNQEVSSDFKTWFTANTTFLSKLSVDLTTLSGWANLTPGNHTIKIVAKGTGYRDSEKSAGVEVTKGAASIPILADATWEQINQASQAGTASNYWAVGDEKTFTLSTGEAVTVQILGFNHDDLTDGSGKAGITFGMKNYLRTGYQMNSSDTNAGGWDSSYARTSIMPTFLGQLPSDLQNVIKEVNKKTSQGNRSSRIITSVDKLFLLSHIELMGTNKYRTDSVLSAQGEGVQYDYYKNAIIPTPVLGSNKFTALSGNTGTFYTPNTNNASSYINSFGETKTTAANFYYNYNNAKSSGSSATAGAWGLRSPYLDSSEYFAYVNADGNVSSKRASNLTCRWFGFCV